MKITTKILVACLPVIVSGALFAASIGERADKPNAAAQTKAKNALAQLPLSFEPNRGQTDPRVQFLSRGPGYTVFFTKDETVMSLKDTNTSSAVVRMKFVGGTNSATAHPLDTLPGKTNYLVGNDSSKWLTDVPEYTKLRYENVYPGIDVLYQGDHQKLRYDFIVKAGADPSVIQMAFQGADKISVNKDGNLALTIDGKTLVTTKPYTYQEDGGTRKEIASRFVLNNGRVTFELAKYDTAKDVVIDPSVVFVTYLGGMLNDSVNGVAVVNPTLTISSPPSAYFVTGSTSSPNFPTTAGVLPTCGATPTPGCNPNGLSGGTLAGAQNAFVTKIAFATGTVVWSTYLGGNSRDSAAGIAVDITNTSNANCAAGCPVVVGQTFSANFPTVPFQGTNGAPFLNGSNDAFAAKIAQDGKSFIYSTYLGGIADDQAVGVALNVAGAPLGAGNAGDVFVGGYTDSPLFPCSATPACGGAPNANHGIPTTSSDAFVVKIPVGYPTATGATNFSALTSTLYGGFGEEFAHAIAYNSSNGMVYLGGDTTTASQNFVSPNNVNLPGLTNNTANTGLPGPTGVARGGFVVAFDASTLVRTFASYVAVSPNCATNAAQCNNFETITGIAAEGGVQAAGCSATTGVCTVSNPASQAPTATINATYGNIGHLYITGETLSSVPASGTTGIARAVPGFACVNPIAADSSNGGTQITGPNGVSILTPGGVSQPQVCVTDLITQAPFNNNQAVTSGCQFPLPLNFVPQITCNLAAYVAILDGALVTNPAAVSLAAPVGNQIEYWAYYSSANASTFSNAIAIDTNPTTLSSTYSLGTYQQMYITGSTQLTSSAAVSCLTTANSGAPAATPTTQLNCLPMTNIFTAQVAGNNNSNFAAPSEIFTSYNVGTTTGGGVGGYDPFASPGSELIASANTVGNLNEIDGFVARFNANGLAASAYGGQGSAASGIKNMGYGTNETPEPPVQVPGGTACPAGGPCDHSALIHTPQFNFGEYIYGTLPQDGSSTPNTVGNAIAVDPTRATIIGGATNVNSSPGTKACGALGNVCNFATSNAAFPTNAGGNDGWVSVLFFNDILSNAAAQASANPWLTPGAPLLTTNANTTVVGITGCALAGNCSYIQTTPAPFGPTFDFALSDPATQTQTFQVLFTGQAAGQLAGTTPFFIPADIRSGTNTPTLDNGEPGSGIAYYLPCQNPSLTFTSFIDKTGSTATSQGFYNNAYPAPGGPYGPMTCAFPTKHLYESLPILFSGWPGLTAGQANGTLITPGWLIVSQDVNPGVVRLQLDRRAAAGLLEGTYVAQFLVTTLDPNEGYTGHPAVQWPPCGPQSSLNPYTNLNPCNVGSTQLPADNVSILVTVRLVVRPTLFLSRNSGLLTGVTSSLAANPLYGPNIGNNPLIQSTCTGFTGSGGVACPATDLIVQQGTGKVPDWWFVGGPPASGGAALHGNDLATWPNTLASAAPSFGLGSILGSGNNGVNSTSGTCISGTVPGVFVPNLFTLSPGPQQYGQIGNFTTSAGNLLIPCPVFSATLQDTWGTSANNLAQGSAAYARNGPGDVPAAAGSSPSSTPTMTFLYDVGTVLTITPTTGSTACSIFAGDPTNNANTNECNLSIEQNLAPYRPDQPVGVTTYNAEWQGGQDPLTQRNDATVHDYYVTAEGNATISVTAVNCTGWNPTSGHNNLVGNWLGVQIGGVSLTGGTGVPTAASYTPICSDETSATVGTHRALATGCSITGKTPGVDSCNYTTGAATIGDDSANPGAVGGQQIQLDFLAKAFTGGCTGQSADTLHNATTCATSSFTGPRTIYNGIPTGFYTATVYVWSSRAKNVVPGYCLGASMPSTTTTGADPVPLCPGPANNQTGPASNSNPNPEVVVTGQQSFNVQLFVFDTTEVIQITPNICPTNGINPGQTIPLTGQVSNSENLFTGNINPPYGPGSPVNYPSFPQNANDTVVWSLVPWSPSMTTAQLLSCALPVGGQSNNLGTINNTGPISETSFTAAAQLVGQNTTGNLTFYTCRPTVAPAFLAQPNWKQDPVKFPPYPGNFAGYTGPVPSLASQTCSVNAGTSGGGGGGQVTMTGTKIGIIRNLPGGTPPPMFNFDSNGNGNGPAPNDPADRVDNFLPPDGGKAGDIGVVGDWAGTGHAAAGWFRPATGEWWLDLNNDGTYTAGTDLHYQFGTTGDVPVIGDWAGLGKSAIGVVRNGFFWILDLNADGQFTQPSCAGATWPNCGSTTITGDAAFAFGGAASGAPADVPVVGNWNGNVSGTGFPVSQAGMVRTFWNGTTASGGPFLWLLDTGAPGTFANVTPLNGHGIGATVAFGGASGDVPITGDWYNTGVTQFGDFRAGFLFVLDGAVPLAPQNSHNVGFSFAYGGLPGDKPITGKW